MKLVFDANILIDALRQNKKVLEIVSEFENSSADLYLPSIIIFELFSGKSSKDREQIKKISDFLNFFEVVDLDKKIARRAGEIYRDISGSLEAPDYIVAATAMELNASVVTLNIKHFQKIPGLSIYKW